MALIWTKLINDDLYEVRNAGKSLRLYKNGVFHTQYHPKRIVTGDVWELMLVASLNISPGASVLVLGAGGGAIMNLLNHFLDVAHIDVVEIDAEMIGICKKFFLKKDSNIQFYHSDARDWINQSKKQYDLVIDDVFGECEGQPQRAISYDEEWSKLMNEKVKAGGRLVINFEHFQELKKSALMTNKYFKSAAGFVSWLKVSSPRYQNCIGLFSKSTISSQVIRKRINEVALLKSHGQSYQLRSLP